MECFGKLKPVYLVVSAVFMRSSHFVFSCNGFRSTLHRVMPVGKERYSVALTFSFFLISIQIDKLLGYLKEKIFVGGVLLRSQSRL